MTNLLEIFPPSRGSAFPQRPPLLRTALLGPLYRPQARRRRLRRRLLPHPLSGLRPRARKRRTGAGGGPAAPSLLPGV